MTVLRRIVIHECDALEGLRRIDDGSVQCCVTSPPYWSMRDYGVPGQIGLEPSPQEMVERLAAVFDEVWRVLADDGVCWINIGDSYIGPAGGQQGKNGAAAGRQAARTGVRRVPRSTKGLRRKSLALVPERLVVALSDRGWIVRCPVVWSKPSPMPYNGGDRPTVAHEMVYMITKSPRYYYDPDPLRTPLQPSTIRTYNSAKPRRALEDPTGKVQAARYAATMPVRRPRVDEVGDPVGANARSVWTIPPEPTSLPHFAAFPTELPARCIMSSTREGDRVLDPFFGIGRTGMAAAILKRDCVGIELNPGTVRLAQRNIREEVGILCSVHVIRRPRTLVEETEIVNGSRQGD